MWKQINRLAALIATMALVSCSSLKNEASAPIGFSPHKFSETVRAGYLLYLPQGYSPSATNRWPLILFLHGIGENGTNIWKTTVHGPAKYIAKHPDFPFILLSPQCPVGHKWSDEMVLDILDEVATKYAVDTNRIYLTGLSLGGFGTWSLATTYPQRFAAVVPICGGEGLIGIIASGFDSKKTRALKNLPFWVFHGGKDPVVPVAESERMVAELKKFGCKDVQLTIYPDALHDSWTQTYDNPELYDWFLKHSR
jgi:predicted peptidase